jgi:hypothetical protein
MIEGTKQDFCQTVTRQLTETETHRPAHLSRDVAKRNMLSVLGSAELMQALHVWPSRIGQPLAKIQRLLGSATWLEHSPSGTTGSFYMADAFATDWAARRGLGVGL